MTGIAGETLRAWRRSRGWDAPDMARRLRDAARHSGVSTATLSGLVRMIYAWERGDHTLTERYELLYAAVLGIGPEQLAGGPAEEEDVDRREFGLAAMGLLAGNLVPPAKVPAIVTADHLRDLRHSASAIWTRDRIIGGNAQLRDATGQYTMARAMLDRSDYTSTVGAELQSVAAELASCAGFAAHDAGHQPLARTLLTEAVLLAAGDPLLSARAYGLLALQSNALAVRNPGRAREALRFLDLAGTAARHEASPRVHALIWMRRANAAGVLGDDVTIRLSIDNARRELDRGDHHADPQWTGFVDRTEVTAHEAIARLAQGKASAAARVFGDVLSDSHLPPRNRALYTAQLAASFQAAGDQAEAIGAGMHVLTVQEGRSARVMHELRPVREAASPDDEFAARYDAAAAS